MSKSRKRRQLARSRFMRNPSARSLRYEPLEDRRMLAVVTVDTDQDVVDFSDGVTSLREAIFATNLVEGADEIVFDFGHDGPATILLTQGELMITDSLKILGGDRNLLTIDAQQESLIFETFRSHGQTPTVTIEDITLTGGSQGAIYSTANLTILNSSLRNNSYLGGSGGAINAYGGTLKVENSLISDNSATYTGGGIMAAVPTTIFESIIERNSAAKGGGVYVKSPDLFLVASVSETGDLDFSGGDDSLTTSKINSSTIVNNSAKSGGGLWIESYAKLALTASTISGNSANSGFGGGVNDGIGGGVGGEGKIIIRDSLISDNNSSNKGGGIGILRNTVVVENSTITGNNANDGGGFYVSGNAEISGSTIAKNIARRLVGGLFVRAGTVSVSHTIVANNSGSFASSDFIGFVKATHSIIGDNSRSSLFESPVGSPDANGNLIGGPVHGIIDPLLGPLSENGGPTQTHALLPGSPAINAGDLNAIAGEDGVPAYDQRDEGFDRVLSRIDIGAYEVQELGDLNLLVDTLVDESDGDFSRGDLSLREAIELANANPVPDTIRFDPVFAAIAGPLPATILLTEGELAITDSVEIVGLGAELLTIDASGNDPTPDENNGDGSRIFNIDDGDETTTLVVTISGVTLTGGDLGGGPIDGQGGAIFSLESLNVFDAVITNNAANHDGGGIFTKGETTITDSTFTENHSTSFSGGGVFARDTTLFVTGSTFLFNTSHRDGGGLFALLTTSTISDSIFSDNTAERLNGGGLWVKGDVLITETRVSGNSATGGGGIFSYSATTTISDSTISNNTAKTGGGISAGGGGSLDLTTTSIVGNSADGIRAEGGGIFTRRVDLTLQSSSVLGNSAISTNTAFGGGISIFGGVSTIVASPISNNRAEGDLFGDGGGIYGTRAADLEIRGGKVSTNRASRDGGGIKLLSGGLNLQDTSLGRNQANNDGGGLWATQNNVQLENSGVFENHADNQGGGIFITRGSLSVRDSSISGNSSRHDGGGVSLEESSSKFVSSSFSDNRSFEYSGGGLFAIDSSISVVTNSFTDNTAHRDGGGLFAIDTDTTIRQSTFSDNTAETLNGGGIWAKGTTRIDDSTISANSAGRGGGLFMFDDTTIVGSTISGNASRGSGGGIWGNANLEGLTIAHSTIADNRADSNSDSSGTGGGVFVNSGVISLDHTLVAGNHDGEGAPDLAGIVNSSFSLIGFGANFLAPLADNGGPTQTHALLPGSPAIDAGDPQANDVPKFDQRGNPYTRVFAGRIDIGAFEAQPLPGDFDGDGDADGDDLDFLQSDYGSTNSSSTSDSDGDGDTDGTDFLNWQRTFGVGLTIPVSSAVGTSATPPNADDVDDSALREAAVDLAIAVDSLRIAPSNNRRSVDEAEIAIDLALQPVLELTRPDHRATVRAGYRVIEVADFEENLPAELDDEMTALDELFALL